MGHQVTKVTKIEDKYNIWIDPNIDGEQNSDYSNQLEKNNLLNNKFNNVDDAINDLKNIKFKETKIIISGKLYLEFVKKLKENLKDMFIAPKIIVFTSNEDLFLKYNQEYKNENNKFYTFGGITTDFSEVEKFLKNKNEPKKFDKYENNFEPQLTFEYIDKKEKLILPLYFKALIDNVAKIDVDEYNSFLHEKYSKCENPDAIKILDIMKNNKNIPIEILSKFYARLYTAETNFYPEINKDLGTNKIERHLTYIKTLYEGVKLKALPLANKKELYRGSKISKDEINKLINYKVKKFDNLPKAIVFSKSLLSFTKDKITAENFMKMGKLNNNLFRVFFILKKDDNIGYNLSTHCDIEDISFHSYEQEVLFLPFSSFAIEEVKPIDKETYEIQLLYLGRYLKEIKDDKSLFMDESILPESEFKNQLTEFGLIKKEKIENTNNKTLQNEFKKLEKEIEEKNAIIGEINISSNDKNKDIQIINSFENMKRINKINNKEDDLKYENEKEIKENMEIKINGKLIEFSFTHKFENEGNYKIKYLFKKEIAKFSYLFYQCDKLTSLDLSEINTDNLTTINSMFEDCSSLVDLNLSNFNTNNITDMSRLFYNCQKLKKLDLLKSNFNTNNVTNMNRMFYNCNSLIDLNLSNFDTQNVTDMSYMFSGCNNLKNLDISKFNTQNVNNMSYTFNNCNSLTNLNLANFNTKNVINMNCMFYDCNKLTDLDLLKFDTKKVNYMNNMFYNCKSLINLNLENFDTQNVSEVNYMFFGCDSLKRNGVKTKDKKILDKFF